LDGFYLYLKFYPSQVVPGEYEHQVSKLGALEMGFERHGSYFLKTVQMILFKF
jgi:hypothetical protein